MKQAQNSLSYSQSQTKKLSDMTKMSPHLQNEHDLPKQSVSTKLLFEPRQTTPIHELYKKITYVSPALQTPVPNDIGKGKTGKK